MINYKYGHIINNAKKKKKGKSHVMVNFVAGPTFIVAKFSDI